MKHTLLLLALLGCHKTNDVVLQLGAKPNELSQGFTCKDPDMPASYLFERAIDLPNKMMKYSLLIDVVHLGNVLPSCAGEDIVAVCSSSATCPVDTDSRCIDFDFRVPNPMPSVITQQVIDEFNAYPGSLFDNAPDGAVIVRVTAFINGDCSHLPTFDKTSVVGCAFSCPEILDDISGTLTLQLQSLAPLTTSDACDSAVVACAQFPDLPVN